MQKRILIVDDEPAIRDMVAFALRKGEYEPVHAGDAREAQTAIAERVPDLILLDWMLPGSSGIELARHPGNRPVRLAYAEALGQRATAAAGRRAVDVLRPLLADSGYDPIFQRSFARANELSGDLVRAGEAYAEAAYLSGRALDAIAQLEALKARDDLDYYQRARIEARIAAITPHVLEMRRRGIEPERQRPGP